MHKKGGSSTTSLQGKMHINHRCSAPCTRAGSLRSRRRWASWWHNLAVVADLLAVLLEVLIVMLLILKAVISVVVFLLYALTLYLMVSVVTSMIRVSHNSHSTENHCHYDAENILFHNLQFLRG